MHIQIRWLLKPSDLDLHCLQRQGISGFNRTRVQLLYFLCFFLSTHCFYYFSTDSKLEKKKKFKPFQKVRNFFRGSSKKRFKGEGDASLKSHSISALHTQDGDEDDDGG